MNKDDNKRSHCRKIITFENLIENIWGEVEGGRMSSTYNKRQNMANMMMMNTCKK
jgi:hypothetical protein